MVETQIKMTMTADQAKILIDALDFYVRTGLGQTSEFAEVLRQLLPVKDREALRKTMEEVKTQQLELPGGSSYGIGNPRVKPLVHDAYDVKKALEKVVARAEGHNPISVWHDGNIVKYGPGPLVETSFVKDGVETPVISGRL